MEQSKLKLVPLFLGIFVIGILLMTFSFTDILGNYNKLIFSISIYLLGLIITLYGLCIYLKINKLNILFCSLSIDSTTIFIYTNIAWFLIPIGLSLDLYMMESIFIFESFAEIYGFFIIVSIVVNVVVSIFSININAEFREQNWKNEISFSSYFMIFLAILFILIFSLIIVLLLVCNLPITAICFTAFILILGNVIHKLKS